MLVEAVGCKKLFKSCSLLERYLSPEGNRQEEEVEEEANKEAKKKVRLKTECSKCGSKVHLQIDYRDEQQIGDLETGEYLEYKCPVCEEWAAMKVLE